MGFLLAATALLASHAFALGKTSLDLELDAYYSSLGLTIPFVKGGEEADVEKSEIKTYRDMLVKALVPRYLILEASLNPMPLAGVLIRDRAERFYQEAQVSPSLNLVEAMTAGFEEPYALSLFLGKVIDFAPGRRSLLGRAQKGYVGYLASVGNYHIMNNLLIPDRWLELEAKVKGDQESKRRKMSWSFRFGRKFHENPEVLDVYYVGIRRNRVDFEKTRYSFLLSSAIEYRVDFNRESLEPVGHYVMLEKNFPLRKRRWTLSLGLGYLWQSQDKYSGGLARRRRRTDAQALLRPNLKF